MTEREGVEFSAAGVDRAQGPGALLRKMREAKKISLDEMAKQLRFTPQRLTQIENDDYTTMGSSTFARGYLRTYARLLGMPETEVAEIVHLFDSQDLKVGILSNTPRLIHEKMAHSNHKFMRGFSLLVILIVVILAGFWWHNRNSAADKASAVQDSANSGGSPDVTGVNPTPGANNALDHPIPLQSTTAVPDNNAPAPASAQQPSQTAEAPATPPADNPKSKKVSRTRAAASAAANGNNE